MEKIALLTDSACDLSLEVLNKYNIHLLPLNIIYSTKEYRDILDISADTVYENLSTEIPSTSLPSMGTIEKVIEKIENSNYTHIIAITLSSGLSGTFNALRLALENHTNLISYVFDSKILATPQGIIVETVAKLIKKGTSFDKLINLLPKIKESIFGYFTLNTLTYLKKGGRIGKVAGTIGELLDLKPVIGIDEDGVYYTLNKARGRKQALSKLTKILKEHLNTSKCNVWVLQGGCIEESNEYFESLKKLDNIVELNKASVSPALGVHTGPGLIGLAVQRID